MTLFETLHDQKWQSLLENKVDPEVIAQLSEFLAQQMALGKPVLPTQSMWFRALNEVSLDDVRVVILGQDPYHGPGQAQGLSFSVPQTMKVPPSLRNIFKELATDVHITNNSGDLSRWASQGVLLLNAVLTVEQAQAGSHARHGWEHITDALIRLISEHAQHVVFMLWGGYAEKKVPLIDSEKHLVLCAAHPSPLSAHRGWFGCRHFSKANQYLRSHGLQTINWQTDDESQLSIF